jgi:dinuclear metal center YbgI/SA1388 family protein
MTMPTNTYDITAYLDEYLRTDEVADSPEALNGLQVDHDGPTTRIAVAVDACLATIEAASDLGADLLLVHHGLFWGGLEPLTGRHGKRIRRLVESGIALYSAHIPLDLHPEVGNNVVLATALGVEGREWFGDYKGEKLGVAGLLSVDFKELAENLRTILGITPHTLPCGPEKVSRVGIISGGGADMMGQARDAAVDTFITGEGKHHTYFDAEEWGLNVIFAGHYATETVGVKALAKHISTKFDLPWDFIDHPTGL